MRWQTLQIHRHPQVRALERKKAAALAELVCSHPDALFRSESVRLQRYWALAKAGRNLRRALREARESDWRDRSEGGMA